ncbi:MAG: GNAT family N-acetyltransferase [Defluviitaleaceae bacterium]|nr:GNAT family N-acetyltransferase [Defluviitaleaceae bacterium]MCL2274673.1 GNAT family N-acetyltransferase [Defluviitaleaceae bacterium]MCL2275766.1 GNAT family N-acetyltransferase [Defluviitaleaceae bacterium]
MYTYLQNNPLAFMDFLTPIKRGTAKILHSCENGVCLLEEKSGAYMASAGTRQAGETILKLLPPRGVFSFHQRWMAEEMQRRARFDTFTENVQVVYDGPMPLPASTTLVLKPLDISHLPTVLENYDVAVGADYLRQTLADGRLFGGYYGGRLVGFGGIHAEGSIGLLKVFAPFQNKGYGTALVRLLTDFQLSQNAVPFAQIEVRNAASLAVFAKAGYALSPEKIYWLF